MIWKRLNRVCINWKYIQPVLFRFVWEIFPKVCNLTTRIPLRHVNIIMIIQQLGRVYTVHYSSILYRYMKQENIFKFYLISSSLTFFIFKYRHTFRPYLLFTSAYNSHGNIPLCEVYPTMIVETNTGSEFNFINFISLCDQIYLFQYTSELMNKAVEEIEWW